MKEEPKTIAEVGYFVEPAKNGGFILFSGGDSGPMRRDQYAFTNELDLLAFLKEVHTPLQVVGCASTADSEPC